MREHTKCSIVVHYELDKGIESGNKFFFALYCGLSLILELTFKMQQIEFSQAVVNIKKRILC